MSRPRKQGRKLRVAPAVRQRNAPVDGGSFDEVLALIESAKRRAYQAVNAELVELYWRVDAWRSTGRLSRTLRQIHADAAESFKNAYTLEFLGLPGGHSEADLHRALEYALSRTLSPALVAEYETVLPRGLCSARSFTSSTPGSLRRTSASSSGCGRAVDGDSVGFGRGPMKEVSPSRAGTRKVPSRERMSCRRRCRRGAGSSSFCVVATPRWTRITFDPAMMGGRPCIRGLRVTVGTILGLLATGQTHEEILAALPYLEEEDIREALSFAAWRVQERELPLPTV